MFLICKRHHNNDVSCFQDSTFATYAQWRRPCLFSEWPIRPSCKTRDFKPHSHCADVATVHPDAGQPVYRDAPGHIS